MEALKKVTKINCRRHLLVLLHTATTTVPKYATNQRCQFKGSKDNKCHNNYSFCDILVHMQKREKGTSEDTSSGESAETPEGTI